MQWKMGEVKQAVLEHDSVVPLGSLQWWDHVSDCALFHSVWLDWECTATTAPKAT
jgi:hypothetical protein